MREESHLDDMRSAIRGDFERLAERRGGQELMSVAPETAQPDAASEEPVPDPAEPTGLEAANDVPAAEPEQPSEEREAPPPAADEPVAEDDAEPEPAEAEEEAELAEEPGAPARRSWLDRLLGR